MPSSGSIEFDRLRSELMKNVGLRNELEYALVSNVNRVDPSRRENRMGSGAAVEWILASASYSAGILTLPGGHGTDGFDLRDLREKAKGLWSVKNSTKKRSDFRLTNGLGGPGKGFVEPVVMLSPSLPGLTFAHPQVHDYLAARVKKTGDATLLPFRAVLDHAESHPECVAVCKMPENKGVGTDDPWMDYVNSLLDSDQFPLLSRMFREAKRPAATIVSEIEGLVQLRDSGALTEEQFQKLISRI